MKQIPKAYNHNVGDTLPQRQFMPDEELGELFTDEIMEGVIKILKRNNADLSEETDVDDLEISLGSDGSEEVTLDLE